MENLEEIVKQLQEENLNVLAYIGNDIQVGGIKGLTYDANGTPILEVYINPVSNLAENTESFFNTLSTFDKELYAKDWCIEHGYTYLSNDDNGVMCIKIEEGKDIKFYHSFE